MNEFTLMVTVAVEVQPDPLAFSDTVTENFSPSENPLNVIVVLEEKAPRGTPL